MTGKKLNLIIPMAGFGTRLRPHTWSKPKPLVSIAGKTVLDHVLEVVATAADLEDCQLALIVGYLGDQVRDYMEANYPEVETHYYQQEEMLGQSHAIAMAREQLQGPTLVLFSDTIVEDDMSFLLDPQQQEEAVIWVRQVEDPRRFGVVDVGPDGYANGLIEKPDSKENDLAVVGYYYFSKGEDLLAAIDRQIKEEIITKGEFFIADAISLMLEDGLKLLPKRVNTWLDAGLPDTVLESNRYLLAHGRENNPTLKSAEGVTINAPVYIHPSVEISGSTIGPHVSIGAGCKISGSTISDTVIEADAQLSGCDLQRSLIGERSVVSGAQGSLDIGDDCTLDLQGQAG
ncbi:MAG: sugar phosphate nucleotidyltransferase [Chloroflexota bacterium]